MNAILTSGALALTCGLLTAQGSDLPPADINADQLQFQLDYSADMLKLKLKVLEEKEFMGAILVSMTSRRAQILPDEAPILMDWMLVKAGKSEDGELQCDLPMPKYLPPLQDDLYFQAIVLSADQEIDVAPVLRVAPKTLPALEIVEIEGDYDPEKEPQTDADKAPAGWQIDADLSDTTGHDRVEQDVPSKDVAQAEEEFDADQGGTADLQDWQIQQMQDDMAAVQRRPGVAEEQGEQSSDDEAFDALRNRLSLELMATDSLPPWYSLMASFKAPDHSYDLDVQRVEQTETGARVYLVIVRNGENEKAEAVLRNAGANLGQGIQQVEVFLAVDDGNSKDLEFRGVRVFRTEK